MTTCKDCIHYAVCCKYDMYGDCAKECKSFADKNDWVKPVRCKDCEHSEEGFGVVLRDGILKREKVWLCSYYGTDEVPEEIVEENGYCSNGRRKENV